MTLSRRLIATAVAACLTLPSPARAAGDASPEHLAEDIEAALYFLCRDYGTIAATVMRIRQQETPRAVAMSTVRRVAESIVATATGTLPRFGSVPE